VGLDMKTFLGLLMISDAALFLFSAVQHSGVGIGPFREPRIIPATTVEALCGLCLLCGAIALFRDSRVRWRVALITNFIALGGVLSGIVALAAGAGPRTTSNDLYHRLMLLLIGASVLILFSGRISTQSKVKIKPRPNASRDVQKAGCS